ncbi:DUF3566 domain-containing protein [Janibacter limosus]|uniref:DUF3566 domain-containing protein n=1 Tax=Janibacter limosus TaxID=53458 RepID=UPI000AC813B1|nr:DUF3566 domain-containing protein [Janibacter limosus]
MSSTGETTATRSAAGSSQPRRTQTAGAASRPAPRAGRRVKLMVSRVDPFSVMKVGFLVSVAMGIALVVMTAVVWVLLSAMGVFDSVNELAGQIIGEGSGEKFDVMDFLGFGRVVSLSIVIAVVDVFLLTAIATLGAFLYNIVASLVGGVHMTLTDD